MNSWQRFWSMVATKKEYLAIGPIHIPWHGFLISILMIGSVFGALAYDEISFNSSNAAVALKFKATLTCSDNTDISSGAGDVYVAVSWPALTGAKYYSIRRVSLHPFTRWTYIAKNISPTDNPSYLDTTTARDVRYFYQIRAQGARRSRMTPISQILTNDVTCSLAPASSQLLPFRSPGSQLLTSPSTLKTPRISCPPQPPCSPKQICPQIEAPCRLIQ